MLTFIELSYTWRVIFTMNQLKKPTTTLKISLEQVSHLVNLRLLLMKNIYNYEYGPLKTLLDFSSISDRFPILFSKIQNTNHLFLKINFQH